MQHAVRAPVRASRAPRGMTSRSRTLVPPARIVRVAASHQHGEWVVCVGSATNCALLPSCSLCVCNSSTSSSLPPFKRSRCVRHHRGYFIACVVEASGQQQQ